jgi:hypothetical protein
VLTGALVLLAFVAGAAGTWSPCGFSVIETISDPRRRVLLCSGTFACGAVGGAVSVFVTLAFVGAGTLSLGSTAAAVGVACAALVGAIVEARGARVRPQSRRQLPEGWRRSLPLPLACLLYGILLGSGFVTFLYTFALWSLAAILIVIGSVKTGALVGVGFGIGRALPVMVVAPVAHSRRGRILLDVMAQRPRSLRVVRCIGAAGLVAVAVASTAGAAAPAASLGPGRDPSVAGDLVVWTTPTGGVARQEGSTDTSSVPALSVVGGSLLAWRVDAAVHIVRIMDNAPVVDVDVPGINALAVSDQWLVTRARLPDGATELVARSLADPASVRRIASARPPSQLGRPALEGDLLVYHLAGRRVSSIIAADLASATARVVRRSTSSLLTNPSVLEGELLYDRQTSRAQLVQLGPLGRSGADRVVYRIGAPSVHDLGHEHGYSSRTRSKPPTPSKWRLWTTAVSARNVYLTLLPRTGAVGARLVSVSR